MLQECYKKKPAQNTIKPCFFLFVTFVTFVTKYNRLRYIHTHTHARILGIKKMLQMLQMFLSL